MDAIRLLLSALAAAAAVSSALMPAAVLGWWLAAPSQTVVEAAGFVLVRAAAAAWIAALIGLGLTRSGTRRATLAGLLAGVVLVPALHLGPGSIATLSEIVVENRADQPLAALRLEVGSVERTHPALTAGGTWEVRLPADTEGRVRLVARDASGQTLGAVSALLPGEPERLTIRIGTGGEVTLAADSLRTRWSRIPDRLLEELRGLLGG
jgi:hypothetical protein